MAFHFRVHSRFDFGPDSFDKYKAPIETTYHISFNNVFRYLEVASTSMSHSKVQTGSWSIVYKGKM